MTSNEALTGLTAEKARRKLAEDGFNELDAGQGRSLLKIALEIGRDPMFLLLLGAGSIYLLMGDVHEAAILLGFVFVIMAVTALQEHRTEKALDALRDLSSPRALVIRDGQPVRIPGREVVREDLLVLNEGDRVPADGVVLVAHELAADESLLTGESVPVPKQALRAEAEPGDAERVSAGTLVTRGQGLARITAIGTATMLGRIGQSLQSIEDKPSPLQQEMGTLTKKLAIIGTGLSLVLIALFVALRGQWMGGLLAGITLAMSLLPQEFPVIMIIFLAFGARRIAEHRVLTRRLSAIETLGETTVLCVDKTGTLTQNRMTVAALMAGDDLFNIDSNTALTALPEQFHELLEYGVLASETEPHDPMEQAFHRLAQTHLADTQHLHPDWDIVREYELSPELPAMSHLWRTLEPGHHAVAAKGAPEAIVDLCHLPPEAQAQVAAQAKAMADRGLRVLGVAKSSHKGNAWPAIQHDFDFAFLGLVGLADPLRLEVPAAVQQCHHAGIRVVMITGDHPRTAQAIAAQAGIDSTHTMTGAELLQLPPAQLVESVKKCGVFARVTPQQKLAIVEALKAAGEVVAMTGDGVNDAPALKSAHIGIAMGKRGTDVAREAAALVLLEDDFGAIVEAVGLGRRIFANLRLAMIYTLAVHIPIIGLSVLPLLLGLPLLLAPIHIAFFELVISPACSVVFEAQAADRQVMRRPPRKPGEHLVSTSQIGLSLTLGMVTTLMVALFYWGALTMATPATEARALAFVALIAANSMLIFSCRSMRPSLKIIGGNNKTVLQVLSATLVGLIAITCIPPLAAPFGFSPASWGRWLAAFGIGTSAFIIFEAAKQIGTKCHLKF